MNRTRNRNILQLIIHFTAWLLVFGLPFLIFWKNNDYGILEKISHTSVVLLSLLIVFYINFFVLIEKYLFQRKTWKYIFYNIILILIVGLSVHFWQEAHIPLKHIGINSTRDLLPPAITFLFRDIFSLLLTMGLSIAVKMTGQWYKVEAARQEEINERTEAELTNLRQQLNPHFLFNTLNNIYALIEISPEKAQAAMLELSKLLRYVLYENNSNFVPLTRELNFIQNYIELMRIRLNPEVEIKINIDIKEKEKGVAPLLFITLIENAFKHGISPSKSSFIYIDIHQNKEKQLDCKISNSYFPKDESDQSGSGIGLNNLSRRLEILYPKKHVLRTEKKGNSFVAELTIPLKPINEK